MFECRIRKDKFPKEGDVVVVKIVTIGSDTVKAQLLEYGNIDGLILTSELSKKRFRSIAQVAKPGNVEVCQVLKVEEDKGFIDLSLKRVSEKEKLECRDSFSKAKLAYQIIARVCKHTGGSIQEMYEKWVYDKEAEYGSLFSYFAHAKGDLEILNAEPHGDQIKRIIEDQFKASSFKVRADVDVTCVHGGVEGIKEAFRNAVEEDGELEVLLVKSPTYSIVRVSEDKDEAFKAVNKACATVRRRIEEMDGTFNVVNEAKVYGEKSRHTILEEAVEEESDSD